jgi:hypothetical protein
MSIEFDEPQARSYIPTARGPRPGFVSLALIKLGLAKDVDGAQRVGIIVAGICVALTVAILAWNAYGANAFQRDSIPDGASLLKQIP